MTQISALFTYLSPLKKVSILLISFFVLQACASTSEKSDKLPLSLDKLYADNYFASERGPYFRWLDDGSGYTVLEARNNDKLNEKVDENAEEAGVTGSDIVFYTPDGGNRKVLITFESLTPKGHTEPLAIDNYSWSQDGKWALIYTNSQQVWRSRSRGDYWLLNLETKALSQIGPQSTLVGEDPESTRDKDENAQLMFAKFSPDSQKIAYVYKNNLYYQPINDISADSVTALTSDGNNIVINGNFDWVYEEEFSIADGFRWSPDSQKIAYWQLDTSGVKMFHMINNTDTLYPEIISFPYPKAGETNSAVRVGSVNISSKETQWVELGGDNRDRYIPRMNWATASQLLVQDVDRPQQNNKLMLFNVDNGSLTQIFTDADSAFIERFYDAEFINDGKHFIWHSERDGWRNLYRIATDGSVVTNLTPGGFDIVQMLAFNENNNEIFFTASPDNVAQRYLYKASLDGSAKPQKITPQMYAGHNHYYMSKDTSNALHTHSAVLTPSSERTIRVAGHETVKTLVENQKLKAKLAEHELANIDFIQVNASDNTVLDAYIMTPKNIDKSAKYPVVFYVYGEPAGQTVQDVWDDSRFLFNNLLVQEGFIVVSVDNRGTRAPKGREWRKSIYKKIGTITAQDQVDALDELAKRYSFIDTERVGVFGHSGGGSSTLTMLFKHGDKFHAGVAIAPVPDIGLYDTIYQERYSGNPNTDPESYYNTSSINFVEGFVGKLLLMHGTGDDNVHYQGSERLINELIKHNKQFEFMAYPNRAHGIRKGKNTLQHRQTMLLNFFKRHLLE